MNTADPGAETFRPPLSRSNDPPGAHVTSDTSWPKSAQHGNDPGVAGITIPLPAHSGTGVTDVADVESAVDQVVVTMNFLLERVSPEADVTVISPGPAMALAGTVTTSLLDVDRFEMVALAPPITHGQRPGEVLPLDGAVALAAALAGATLFRSVSAPPVQNRGSVARLDRKVAVTEPPVSASDSRQGAVMDGLQGRRNFPLLGFDPAPKQTSTPAVLGSLPTVSVTVKVAPVAKPDDDRVDTAAA